MLRRFSAILLALVLVLTLFAACGGEEDGPLTQEKAKQIVMDDLGANASAVSDIHVHVVTEDGVACYSIHVTYGKVQKTYLIHGITGEILSITDGGH